MERKSCIMSDDLVVMDNTNHNNQPYHQTRSKMKAKTYGSSSYKCHQCRVPLLMVAVIVAIELLLFTNVSHCANAKSYILHWNTTNPLFRIDNNDHVIDVNKGNLQFEYDQVHIICPYYEPGTNENETEKYIIYNVSKVEYETCRITNPNPRIIAICDKPFNTTLVTISFRPFTPQPGGLEFKPGNDYYFISTSSRDDLHRRIGGRCSSGNTKVIFKVFGGSDSVRQTTESPTVSSDHGRPPPRIDIWPNSSWKNHHNDDASSSSSSDSTNNDNDQPFKPNESSNKNYNTNNSFGYPSTQRPIYVNRDNHNSNLNSNNNSGGNNINKPTKKTTDEYDSRQNEVVKNEELTYNNHSSSLRSSTIYTVLTSLIIVLMRNRA